MAQLYDTILLDGRQMLFRTAYSIAARKGDIVDGERTPTGAVHGFIRSSLRVWEQHAQHNCLMVVCWEGGYRHRRLLYPDYKANRRHREMPPDIMAYLETLDKQELILRGFLAKCGWAQVWSDGYEADDVMATLAAQTPPWEKCCIYTADGDLHQCVNPQVHVLSPPYALTAEGKAANADFCFDEATVTEKWGVPPCRVAEVKALAGDSGDNIPGAPGIGNGWALKLLDTYPDLDTLISEAVAGWTLSGFYEDKPWSSDRITKIIADNADLIRISHKLALVATEAPLTAIPRAMDKDFATKAIQLWRMKELLMPNNLATIWEIGDNAARLSIPAPPL